jgi:hypothetical protein
MKGKFPSTFENNVPFPGLFFNWAQRGPPIRFTRSGNPLFQGFALDVKNGPVNPNGI